MIEAISSEEGRLRDAAVAAAAGNFRPLIPAVVQVKPDPEQVRAIGTSADAFRGASPDLQSLLDALLTNFGNDHDLIEAQAKDSETEARIRDNNEGSREAVGLLSETVFEGEKTVQSDRRIDQRRTRFENGDLKVDDFDTAQLQDQAETRADEAESRFEEAEMLSSAAHDSAGKTETRCPGPDADKLRRSAELREQKTAALESATRLHRIMLEKVVGKAREQAEKERVRKREQEALKLLESDSDFAARLREMNQMLQSLR